uniref:Hyalin repeat protein n=1 Tax=Pyxidicoccus sp. TaxID=2023737 RepID=A0A3S7UYY0_9BACT|nr:hyalin repeat protein [Pyxidicoccus sp.]
MSWRSPKLPDRREGHHALAGGERMVSGWGWKWCAWLLGLGLVACGVAPSEPGDVPAPQETPDTLDTGGTCPSATRLADFSTGGPFGLATELTGVKGTLYFVVDDGIHGPALWASDGTLGGTRLFRDFDATPRNLTEARGLLFFIVDRTLWRTDGTDAGTLPLVTAAAPPSFFTPIGITGEFRNRLFFHMYTPEVGLELWVSDGTPGGTRLYLDINPGPPSSGGGEIVETASGNLVLDVRLGAAADTLAVLELSPTGAIEELYSTPGNEEAAIFRLTAVGDRVFFLVDLADGAPSLFTSDGTPGAATLLYSWDGVGTPRDFTAYEGRLYFVAEEDDSADYAGLELWVSDGTPAGTGRLVDIRPGEDASWPRGLTVFEGLLYFSADDGEHGRELWVSDGTAEGTELARDIRPGPEGSSPYGLTVASRKLYFAADDGEHGIEPWKVFHGRARLVEDVVPGPVGSAPQVYRLGFFDEDPVFARAGSYLFFSSESLEFWSMRTGAYCPPSGTR